MDQVRLRNFRCFGDEQTARSVPLTLPVGENSTGKTSFMALIRALWDAAYGQTVPDFKEVPYDLGSFDEIAYYRGGRGGGHRRSAWDSTPRRTPQALKGVPAPTRPCIVRDDVEVTDLSADDASREIRFRTDRGEWRWEMPTEIVAHPGTPGDVTLSVLLYAGLG